MYQLSDCSCSYQKSFIRKLPLRRAAAEEKGKRVTDIPAASLFLRSVSSCGLKPPLDEKQVDFLGIKVNQH